MKQINANFLTENLFKLLQAYKLNDNKLFEQLN